MSKGQVIINFITVTSLSVVFVALLHSYWTSETKELSIIYLALANCCLGLSVVIVNQTQGKEIK